MDAVEVLQEGVEVELDLLEMGDVEEERVIQNPSALTMESDTTENVGISLMCHRNRCVHTVRRDTMVSVGLLLELVLAAGRWAIDTDSAHINTRLLRWFLNP